MTAAWHLVRSYDARQLNTFCGLGQLVPAVRADPNWLIGIDDFITIKVFSDHCRHNIDNGLWDCHDGCDCRRLWVIEVDGSGTVALVSYREQGESWCEFGE